MFSTCVSRCSKTGSPVTTASLLGVSHAAVREFSGEHAPRFVHGDVELPPATPSPFSPLRCRPLALADDAETRGVHDEVHRLGRQESAQLDL
jgi:hypothetical protein